MNSRKPDDFLLGQWLVQPGQDRISDGTREVHLEPKVMDLLVFLASRPGEVLTRREIFAAVWGQEFVCATTLTSSMAVLRRALDDDAHLPRFIETIPKRGYRLLDVAAAPHPTAAASRPPPWRRPAVIAVVLAAAATVAGVIVAVGAAWREAGTAPGSRRPVVLVLPLQNDSGEAALDDLGRRAAGLVAHALRVSGRLDVVDDGAAEADPALAGAVGRVLGAVRTPVRHDLVVTGSFGVSGRTLRLRAQVADSYRFEATHAVPPLDGDRDDPLPAIEELGRRVAGLVESRLDYPGRPLILECQAPRIASYNELVAAVEALDDGDREAADVHLERAIARDPGFATPYLVRAFDRLMAGEQPAPVVAELRRLLDTPQLLGPGQRQLVRAAVLGFGDGRWESALAAVRELDRRYPEDAVVALSLAYAALAARRPAEAARVLVEPFAPEPQAKRLARLRTRLLAAALHRLGRFEQELALAREARLLQPDQSLESGVAEVRALAASGRLGELAPTIASASGGLGAGGTRARLSLVAARELATHGQPTAAVQWAGDALRWSGDGGAPAADDFLLEALTWAERQVEALALAERRLAASGRSPDLVADVGVAACRAGRPEVALAAAAELAGSAAEPRPGARAYARARLAAVLGQGEAACDQLARALAQGLDCAAVDPTGDVAFAGLLSGDTGLGRLLLPLG